MEPFEIIHILKIIELLSTDFLKTDLYVDVIHFTIYNFRIQTVLLCWWLLIRVKIGSLWCEIQCKCHKDSP